MCVLYGAQFLQLQHAFQFYSNNKMRVSVYRILHLLQDCVSHSLHIHTACYVCEVASVYDHASSNVYLTIVTHICLYAVRYNASGSFFGQLRFFFRSRRLCVCICAYVRMHAVRNLIQRSSIPSILHFITT